MINTELYKLLPELADKEVLFNYLKMWGHDLPEIAIEESLVNKLEFQNTI